MNKTYRLVWDAQNGTFIAVSEATRGRGKSGGKSSTVSRTVATTLVVLGACLGGSVNAESITITDTQLTGVVAASHVDSLSNTGSLAAQGTGVLINGNVTGEMANRGEIASGSGHGIRVTGNVAAGFLNSVGSRLSAKEHGLFVEGSFAGNLENLGNIVSGGLNAVRVEGAFDGNLVNDTGALLRGKDAAVILSDLTGNITNRGVIASDGKAIEVTGGMTGNLTNESGARIIGSGAALDVTGHLIGDITNRGDLSHNSDSSGATIRLQGDITGNILNAEGARILARRNGLKITGVMQGNLNNAGEIIANYDNWFFTDFTVIFSLPQLQIQLAALEENPGHSN